jgi:hypothetical protein
MLVYCLVDKLHNCVQLMPLEFRLDSHARSLEYVFKSYLNECIMFPIGIALIEKSMLYFRF